MNLFKSKLQGNKDDDQNPLNNVLNNLQTRFTNFIRIGPNPFDDSKQRNRAPPAWAGIADQFSSSSKSNVDDHQDQSEIKRRLSEVHVYRMTANSDIFPAFKSDVVKDRNFDFYFFNKQDAEALTWRSGQFKHEGLSFELITVPLAQFIEHEGYNPTIRLVPDISEVKNALKERQKAGFLGDSFSGVPVFQSDALGKMVDGSSTNYSRPAFFRKEDLEKALREEKNSNQIDLEKHIIQVTALEDIIQQMKDCSASKWNDVVFIPPGNPKL